MRSPALLSRSNKSAAKIVRRERQLPPCGVSGAARRIAKRRIHQHRIVSAGQIDEGEPSSGIFRKQPAPICSPVLRLFRIALERLQ